MFCRRITFPYVHDLGHLLDLLEGQANELPAGVRGAVRLTRFAVTDRYPGVAEPVTEEEYAEFLSIAEAAIDWAAQQVGRQT